MFADMFRALGLILSGDPEVWQIVGVSLTVALAALSGALVVGLPVAYWCGTSRARVARIGIWCAHSLAAFPTVVVGLMFYLALSAQGPLGWTHLLYTKSAMAAAQCVLATPLLVAVVLGALRRLPLAARETLLTHHVATLRRAGWLLWEVRTAIASGAFLGFSRALTELGAALIVGGNIRGSTRTLTTYIALEYDRGDDARAIALGVILLAVALVTHSVMHIWAED